MTLSMKRGRQKRLFWGTTADPAVWAGKLKSGGCRRRVAISRLGIQSLPENGHCPCGLLSSRSNSMTWAAAESPAGRSRSHHVTDLLSWSCYLRLNVPRQRGSHR